MECAAEHALRHGYKSVDTATAYGNEAEVSVGIKASGVPRNEILRTTKLDNPDHLRVPETPSRNLGLNTLIYVSWYGLSFPFMLIVFH